VGALGPSQTSSASTQVVIPAGTASGNYFVIGFADWNGVVPEINDTNNTRATVGYLRVGPDLSITALTGPSSASAGTSILVGDTTRNEGGDTMPASITSFYLSANFTIDATDVLLGSRPVPFLAPGVSDSGSLSLLIPVTGAGTYYIIAKADGGDATSEPQESNNIRLKSITITAGP
jgi:subtilase family serine protease